MARSLPLLLVSLLAAPATFAQSAPPTQDSIREVMNRVHAYLVTATPLRPVNGDTGAPVTLDTLPRNVALAPTDMKLTTYEWGVTYNGMLLATQVTGDQRYKTYVNDRLTGLARIVAHLRANYPDATFETFPQNASGTFTLRRFVFPQSLDDSGSMCAAMIKAHNAGIPNLRPVFDKFVNWVKQKQFRLADGQFARNSPMPNSVWLDDMYMSIPCEAQIGQLNNDPRYYTDAIRQIRRFYSKMFVQGRDLYMHGWIQEMDPHPAFHWARANGWAIMATVELLSVLPKDHPDRPYLISVLNEHATSLRRLQAPSGLWHQLLDRPDSYQETSASAMYVFAMARAINQGWLSRSTFAPVILRGWNGLTTKVNATGQVEGTCIGTGLGWDDTFYLNRPTDVNAAHGYGPIFLAGAEIIFLLQRYPNVGTTSAAL